jgi:hypothetical protein
MSSGIYHVIGVVPFITEDGAALMVRFHDFMVVASDFESAKQSLDARPEVYGAHQVLVRRCIDRVLLTPEMGGKLNGKMRIEAYDDWLLEQHEYRVIHSAPESIREWMDRMTAHEWAH